MLTTLKLHRSSAYNQYPDYDNAWAQVRYQIRDQAEAQVNFQVRFGIYPQIEQQIERSGMSIYASIWEAL